MSHNDDDLLDEFGLADVPGARDGSSGSGGGQNQQTSLPPLPPGKYLTPDEVSNLARPRSARTHSADEEVSKFKDLLGQGPVEAAPAPGEPWDEIIGERSRQPADDAVQSLLQSSAFADILKQRLANNTPIVKQVPVRREDAQIGFGPIDLQPGQSTTVTAMPQALFRGQKLMCVESVPGATIITGIFVGNKNQMISTNGMASALFASGSIGSGTRFDTCQVGLTISMTIMNTSNQPVRWSGVIFGDTIN